MKLLITSAFFIFTAIKFSCSDKAGNNLKVNDQGVNIAYADNGKGDTTLLLVHGWCINKGYWSNQVTYFSKRYRVVTIDLPGFGQSGKNRKVWNTEAFGRDVDSVISQLKLTKVILIGHSMAGDIVLQAALNAPRQVIGLVGVDNFKHAGSTSTSKDTAEYNAAIEQLRHHFRKEAFIYVNGSLFSNTTADSLKRRVLNDVARADTIIATQCMELSNFNEWKSLEAVKLKLFLINSDVHPTDTKKLDTNHIPNQVFYIHATGHFPMIEKPQDFNSALQQVISKI